MEQDYFYKSILNNHDVFVDINQGIKVLTRIEQVVEALS
jgi:hypothetical protein